VYGTAVQCWYGHPALWSCIGGYTDRALSVVREWGGGWRLWQLTVTHMERPLCPGTLLGTVASPLARPTPRESSGQGSGGDER
jgi:hypothetical protein